MFGIDKVPQPPDNWYGSLILDMKGASGLMYRRNRYVDPQTGQFTQADPIGVAGGLNLYGYAEGDPVTYSDPFGLCPWPPSNCFQKMANWGAQRGGVSGWLALNGGALGAGLFAASAGADAEGAVGALAEGRFLAAAGSALLATPGGKGARLAGKIFDYLGDGARAFLNKADDLIIQSDDGLREVRFDFNNPSPHDAPHVHVIEYERVKNNKVEVANERIFPEEGGQ